MANISKVSDRAKLKPRRDPYWQKIKLHCYLGYRKMTPGSTGNWSARYRDDTTLKQMYEALGEFGELPDHERFDAARKAAEKWFTHLDNGGSAEVITVKEACERYVANLRRKRGDKAADDVERRFKQYVIDDVRFAARELGKLKPAHIDDWRNRLQDRPTPNGSPRSTSSLNRDMTCLRAALNLAHADGLVTSVLAWKSKLIPTKDADGRRDIYLDRTQRRALIEHAPADLGQFLQGMCLLPLRPGALAGLTVGMFDKRLKTLKIGKDKHGKDRKIVLPPQTADFFGELAKNKLPTAPLFTRTAGKAWDKDAWKKPVKAAVKAAKLPDDVTIYVLRHSTITDLVHGGLDMLTVAQISGTSARMIELHYGHLRSEVATSALAQLAL